MACIESDASYANYPIPTNDPVDWSVILCNESKPGYINVSILIKDLADGLYQTLKPT